MLPTYSAQLEAVNTEIGSLAQNIYDANSVILEGLTKCNKELLESAKESLKNMSSKTNDIDNSIVKILALFSPEAKDLRLMVTMFKITNELLRASANTRSFITGLVEYCSEIDAISVRDFAVPMQKSTVECLDIINKMLHTSCADETQELYNRLLIAESKTDDLYELLQESVVKQAPVQTDFEKYTKMLRSLRKSEKIADRALNIGNVLLFAKLGGELKNLD